ncbi:MAG: hypothetical protein ABT940_01385 [Alphaproteobacteria bacterium]
MKFPIRILSLLAMVLVLTGPLHAADKTGGGEGKKTEEWYALIGCPEFWPGSDDPTAKLEVLREPEVRERLFRDAVGVVGLSPLHDEGYYEASYHRDLTINCAYQRGHRILVEVPGYVTRCIPYPSLSPKKRRNIVCKTTPEPAGSQLGPVTYHLVEPLTLKSLIRGFGLRQTVEQVLSVAKTGDYRPETTTDANGRVTEIRLIDDPEWLTIRFSPKTGLSPGALGEPGPPRKCTWSRKLSGLS